MVALRPCSVHWARRLAQIRRCRDDLTITGAAKALWPASWRTSARCQDANQAWRPSLQHQVALDKRWGRQRR